MEAVVMRRKEVVQLLIEAGADMDMCSAVVIINNNNENIINITTTAIYIIMCTS